MNTSTPEPTSAARAPRWMKLLLAASLGVNLMVAGAVVGRVAGGPPAGHDAVLDAGGDRPGPRGGPPAGAGGIGPLGRALSREDRRALGAALRAERDTLGIGRADMRARQGEMAVVLRADPFVRADMEALLSAQRANGEALAATGQRLLLDRLEAMSAPERAAFADRLERAGQRR